MATVVGGGIIGVAGTWVTEGAGVEMTFGVVTPAVDAGGGMVALVGVMLGDIVDVGGVLGGFVTPPTGRVDTTGGVMSMLGWVTNGCGGTRLPVGVMTPVAVM